MIDFVRRKVGEQDWLQDMLFAICDDIEQPEYVFTGKSTAARRKRGRPRNLFKRESPIPLAERDCSLLPCGRDRFHGYRNLLKKYYQQKPSKRTPQPITNLALRCAALDCREWEGDGFKNCPSDTLRPKARKTREKQIRMTEEEWVEDWENKIWTYEFKRGANDRHRQAPGTRPRKARRQRGELAS